MSRKLAAYITQAALNKALVGVGGCKQSLPVSTRSDPGGGCETSGGWA